jgi:hypothetical protein
MAAYFSWQQAVLKSEMEPTTRLVCLTIGCHMAMDGTGCFPSYALIAQESGLSRRTVIDHVQAAVVHGYLRLEHRERENGSSTSNLYQPVMPDVVQELHPGSAPAAPGVVQELHPHNTPSLTPQVSNPPESPNQSKAPRRGPTTGISLIAFTAESNGVPPAEWGEWASQQFGWDGQRVRNEWDEFADYWTSGNAVGGGLKRDWPATWRSHRRRSAHRRGSGSSGSSSDRGLAAAASAVVPQRHGRVQADGSVDTGLSTAGTSDVNSGGEGGRIPSGEIPS